MTYDPALCLTLSLRLPNKRLYVILAADGTVLDTQEHTRETLPRWITELVQLPEIDTLPSIYRYWKRERAAVRN